MSAVTSPIRTAADQGRPSQPTSNITYLKPARFDIPAFEREVIGLFLQGEVDASTFEGTFAPKWGPVGEEVFNRTYSRNDTGGTGPDGHERWSETCRRVVNGNLGYADPSTYLPDENIELFWALYTHRVVPAGRHLWVTGTKVAQFSKNCWVAGWSRRLSDHFRFLSARLFEGGGVGANYSEDLIASTAPIQGTVTTRFTCRPEHLDIDLIREAAGDRFIDADSPQISESGWRIILVDDSREGWTSTWGDMIDSVVLPDDHRIIFDVSNVRHHGAVLKTFGGTASGPTPLVRSIIAISEILNEASSQERRISGLEAMQIDHEIASAVVSGGARRSARLAAMHWSDPEIFDFIACKADQADHWTANISVEIDAAFREAVTAGDSHALAVLQEVAAGMAANGEPGLIDTEMMSEDEPERVRVTNPCVTGDTLVQTTEGLRTVDDLLDSGPVEVVVGDEIWATTSQGFFKTGTKPVLRLDIDGSPLRVTADHLVSTPDGWRAAGELSVGDVVDLTDSLGNTWAGTGTEAEGYLLGHLVGDGSFFGSADAKHGRSAELNVWDQDSAAVRDLAASYGITHGTKTVTPEVMDASSDFITGFLRGLFDTDGHVEGSSAGAGVMVRLSQSDYEMLGNVRVLLLALGIKSVVRNMHPAESKETPGGTYDVKESFRLIISGEHVERFIKVVGFAHPAKHDKATSAMSSMTRGFYLKPMVGAVRAIAEDGVEDVYDCQVPGRNAFVANGTIVHNCGEATLISSSQDAAGESCNLGSVNLDAFGLDHSAARHGFRLLARFLYRATLNPHFDPAASRIEAGNRRIGAGIMGLQGWMAAHHHKLTDLASSTHMQQKLSDFRQTTRQAADDLADLIGTPRPVKVTAVAPTGSIAKLSGCTPGIHPLFSRRFINRIRFSEADPAWRTYQEQGFKVVDDIYADRTKVVEFPVLDSIVERYDEAHIEQSNEISFDQFNRLVAAVQATFCGVGDGQAISATASIPTDSDPNEIAMSIRSALGTVKGFTAFPDESRELSPLERLTKEQFDAIAGGRLATTGDSNDGNCGPGGCPIR